MERLTYVTENGTVLFSPDGKDAVTIIDISEMGDTEDNQGHSNSSVDNNGCVYLAAVGC